MPFVQVRIWLEIREPDRDFTEPASMSRSVRPPGDGPPNESGASATGVAG